MNECTDENLENLSQYYYCYTNFSHKMQLYAPKVVQNTLFTLQITPQSKWTKDVLCDAKLNMYSPNGFKYHVLLFFNPTLSQGNDNIGSRQRLLPCNLR